MEGVTKVWTGVGAGCALYCTICLCCSLIGVSAALASMSAMGGEYDAISFLFWIFPIINLVLYVTMGICGLVAIFKRTPTAAFVFAGCAALTILVDLASIVFAFISGYYDALCAENQYEQIGMDQDTCILTQAGGGIVFPILCLTYAVAGLLLGISLKKSDDY